MFMRADIVIEIYSSLYSLLNKRTTQYKIEKTYTIKKSSLFILRRLILIRQRNRIVCHQP